MSVETRGRKASNYEWRLASIGRPVGRWVYDRTCQRNNSSRRTRNSPRRSTIGSVISARMIAGRIAYIRLDKRGTDWCLPRGPMFHELVPKPPSQSKRSNTASYVAIRGVYPPNNQGAIPQLPPFPLPSPFPISPTFPLPHPRSPSPLLFIPVLPQSGPL